MLKGKKIELRAPELSDVELLYQWENDQTIWYLSNTVTPFSRFQIEQFVLNTEQDIFTSKQLRLMIDKIEEKGRTTIGSIDLFDFDPVNKRAGMGIMVEASERKKGYASEAVEILIEYCFQVLHLHQVYCNVLTDNNVSLKLFQRIGFEVVGTKKEWIQQKQTWKDEILLQLINIE